MLIHINLHIGKERVKRMNDKFKIIAVDFDGTFLGIKTPDKTRTETATYYMTVSRDKNNNVSFQTFSNEEAYKKATSNW